MPETRNGQFSLDIREWCEATKDDCNTVVRKTCLGLLRGVVLSSPVGNPDLWKSKPPAGYVGGRLRGSWTVTIGSRSTTDPNRIDKTGTVTLQAGSAVLSEAVAGPPVYLMSNLPYSIPIEYGHSTQAPAGMVRVTVANFQRVVSEAVRSTK